jgi:hypothetical protein
MKLILTAHKPRNPFVAASMRRTAGRHDGGRGAQRQSLRRELRTELERLHRSP